MGLLALAAVALITGTLRGVGPLQRAQGIVADVMTPFEIATHKIASPFVDSYNYFDGLFEAKGEVSRLREELRIARELEAQNAAAATENAELRKMLDYRPLSTFPLDYTAINTAVETRAWPDPASAVTLAAGRSDGIRLNDTVVSIDGYFVGTVSAVTDDTARVTLLTDPSVAVSAVDAASPEAQGLVQSNVDSQGGISVYFDRVPKKVTVKKGHLIMTAGWRFEDIASKYPRGIPIGTVLSVSQTDLEDTKQVQIKPLADLGSLQNVKVLIPKGRETGG